MKKIIILLAGGALGWSVFVLDGHVSVYRDGVLLLGIGGQNLWLLCFPWKACPFSLVATATLARVIFVALLPALVLAIGLLGLRMSGKGSGWWNRIKQNGGNR